MAEITKITIEVNGRKIDIKTDELSNNLRRKLRKETEKFINPKKVITEPLYNEGVA